MKARSVFKGQVVLVMREGEAADLWAALGSEVRRRQNPARHELDCWACNTIILEAAGALGAAGVKEAAHICRHQ